jgi:hypothetical protein
LKQTDSKRDLQAKFAILYLMIPAFRLTGIEQERIAKLTPNNKIQQQRMPVTYQLTPIIFPF